IAPTALCTENIIKQFYPRMTDRQFLLTLRIVLVTFSLAALLFALNSRSTMYDMVQSAYKVTLVGAFVPLAAGIFWKRANTVVALRHRVRRRGQPPRLRAVRLSLRRCAVSEGAERRCAGRCDAQRPRAVARSRGRAKLSAGPRRDRPRRAVQCRRRRTGRARRPRAGAAAARGRALQAPARRVYARRGDGCRPGADRAMAVHAAQPGNPA